MTSWLRSSLFGAALILPPVQSANAQSLAVEPLFIETQPGQSAAVRVRNSSSVRQTVEVSIAERVAKEAGERSEEHTSELQSLMRISYAVFCLTNKNKHITYSFYYSPHLTTTHRQL